VRRGLDAPPEIIDHFLIATLGGGRAPRSVRQFSFLRGTGDALKRVSTGEGAKGDQRQFKSARLFNAGKVAARAQHQDRLAAPMG